MRSQQFAHRKMNLSPNGPENKGNGVCTVNELSSGASGGMALGRCFNYRVKLLSLSQSERAGGP